MKDQKDLPEWTGDQSNLTPDQREKLNECLVTKDLCGDDWTESFNVFLQRLFPSEEKDPNGRHTHVCPDCGHRWSHENSCVNNTAAHTCTCGRQVWDYDVRETGGEFISCAAQPVTH